MKLYEMFDEISGDTINVCEECLSKYKGFRFKTVFTTGIDNDCECCCSPIHLNLTLNPDLICEKLAEEMVKRIIASHLSLHDKCDDKCMEDWDNTGGVSEAYLIKFIKTYAGLILTKVSKIQSRIDIESYYN